MKLADMAAAIDFHPYSGEWYDGSFSNIACDEADYLRGKTYLGDGVSLKAIVLNNRELRKAYKLFKEHGEEGMWKSFNEVFDED